MFKLFGALIVVTVFAALGFKKTYNLNKRIKSLKEFKNMFEDLKVEIYLKNTELPKAVKKIGTKYNNTCFIKWSSLMEGSSAETTFIQALEQIYDSYCFNKNDVGVIKCVVASLGRLDLESQVKRLEGGVLALDKHINEVTGSGNEKVRLYIGGSVLLGLFVVILLI